MTMALAGMLAAATLIEAEVIKSGDSESSSSVQSPQRPSVASASDQSGFRVGNRTFLLDGKPIRLFAGSLQHFRIHQQHWEHRLKLAKRKQPWKQLPATWLCVSK
jgi:hypothetical protein